MNEETLFEQALNVSPTELPAWLDQRCAGDPALRQRIEKLLAAHLTAEGTRVPFAYSGLDVSSDPINTPTLVPSPTTPTIGTMLGGKYKLLQSIGEGGMGSVYMAQQTEPVKRTVAIKVIKPGMDSKAVLARFDAERQALAMMDHPNIAKVLDAGATDSGCPYFVMELVKGIPITKFCDDSKLTPKQRLELFLPVCEAMQHSHQKGIIHRDIKPSNVLVAMYDGRVVPKVIDFGVAKATGQALTEATVLTGFGALVGTPEYMSPEQASLNNLDIDTRSDIYSLGVLLYELLSGHTPVDRKSLEKAAIYEILRIVRDVDAPLLSAKLSSIDTIASVAANRRTEPKRLANQFRGELDWVLLKALEKDRTRRYSTASGFAHDIQRYLANEIVEARPPSTLYTFQKFVRRHKGPVIAASLVLLALLFGIAGTTWGFIHAEHRRQEAEFARAEEAKQRELAVSNESKAILAKDEEARQRVIAEEEKQRAIDFQNKALDALRATTGEDVEKLIGERIDLSENERAYLEAIAKRWQAFAVQEGTDQQARDISGEGHIRVANLWDHLGRREDALLEFELAEKIYQALTAEFPKEPEYAQSLARCANSIGLTLNHIGRRVEAQTKIRQALAIQEKLDNEFPNHADYRIALARYHHNLGILGDALGNKLAAIESYRQAAIIEEKLANEFPELPLYRSHLAKSYSNLGVLLSSLGKVNEALEQYRQALAIREKLIADFPTESEHFRNLAISHNNYGNLLNSLGKNAESLEQYRKSIAIKEKLVSDYPGVPEHHNSLAASYKNLGATLRSIGRTSEADGLYRKALAIRERLAMTFPTEAEFREDLASTHNSLASLLSQSNKLELALEQHHLALGIREKLAADFTAVPEYRKDVASSYVNMGLTLRKLDKLQEAEVAYRQALTILEKLSTDFPEVTAYRENLASNFNSLANLLDDLELRDECMEAYHKSRAIRERLVNEHPSIPEYQVDLADVYANIASKLFEADKPAESLVWFQKALALIVPVDESDAKSIRSKHNIMQCYETRSMAYDKLERFAEAEADWNKFIELSPPESKTNLLTERGKRLIRDGMVAEGIERISELSKLPSEDAEVWYQCACAFSLAASLVPDKKDEYADRAMELLQQAVKAGYENAERINKDSDFKPLRDRDDFKKLVTDIEAKSAEIKRLESAPEATN